VTSSNRRPYESIEVAADQTQEAEGKKRIANLAKQAKKARNDKPKSAAPDA
jgi:hypothetical protein